MGEDKLAQEDLLEFEEGYKAWLHETEGMRWLGQLEQQEIPF